MGKYKISEKAKHDLEEIYYYGLEKFGIQKADDYLNRLFECFELISQNPLMFPAIDHIRSGYRKCAEGVSDIYYIAKPNCVSIVRILRAQNTETELPNPSNDSSFDVLKK